LRRVAIEEVQPRDGWAVGETKKERELTAAMVDRAISVRAAPYTVEGEDRQQHQREAEAAAATARERLALTRTVSRLPAAGELDGFYASHSHDTSCRFATGAMYLACVKSTRGDAISPPAI
jgi:hypothetical protein